MFYLQKQFHKQKNINKNLFPFLKKYNNFIDKKIYKNETIEKLITKTYYYEGKDYLYFLQQSKPTFLIKNNKNYNIYKYINSYYINNKYKKTTFKINKTKYKKKNNNFNYFFNNYYFLPKTQINLKIKNFFYKKLNTIKINNYLLTNQKLSEYFLIKQKKWKLFFHYKKKTNTNIYIKKKLFYRKKHKKQRLFSKRFNHNNKFLTQYQYFSFHYFKKYVKKPILKIEYYLKNEKELLKNELNIFSISLALKNQNLYDLDSFSNFTNKLLLILKNKYKKSIHLINNEKFKKFKKLRKFKNLLKKKLKIQQKDKITFKFKNKKLTSNYQTLIPLHYTYLKYKKNLKYFLLKKFHPLKKFKSIKLALPILQKKKFYQEFNLLYIKNTELIIKHFELIKKKKLSIFQLFLYFFFIKINNSKEQYKKKLIYIKFLKTIFSLKKTKDLKLLLNKKKNKKTNNKNLLYKLENQILFYLQEKFIQLKKYQIKNLKKNQYNELIIKDLSQYLQHKLIYINHKPITSKKYILKKNDKCFIKIIKKKKYYYQWKKKHHLFWQPLIPKFYYYTKLEFLPQIHLFEKLNFKYFILNKKIYNNNNKNYFYKTKKKFLFLTINKKKKSKITTYLQNLTNLKHLKI